MAKKSVKKSYKKSKDKKEEVKEDEENEGGLSLDDAFSDDDNVEYGKTKPRKIKKKRGIDEEELEEEIEEIERETGNGIDTEQEEVEIKASKPIGKIKKGDKIKVDSLNLEVDAHIVLIDHGTTKEMAIECFDSKTDRDYQVRYFLDNVESSIEFYELEEIIYNKKKIKRIEW